MCTTVFAMPQGSSRCTHCARLGPPVWRPSGTLEPTDLGHLCLNPSLLILFSLPTPLILPLFPQVLECADGTRVTITPYPAGHLLGGALWRLTINSEDLLYATAFHHRSVLLHLLSKRGSRVCACSCSYSRKDCPQIRCLTPQPYKSPSGESQYLLTTNQSRFLSTTSGGTSSKHTIETHRLCTSERGYFDFLVVTNACINHSFKEFPYPTTPPSSQQ